METLDFFTPIVDDPFDWGRIAAANAFSDVYAMGARPLFALNILGFPVKKLGVETMSRVLAGGASIAAAAGVPVLGGHSIDDPEPKYGMVVTGIVHPDRVLRNVGACPGDELFLTKPLGSGVLTSAIKKGELGEEDLRRVVAVMTHLNRGGAEAMVAVGVHACTDVTGFGLLGHLAGMLRAGGIGAELAWSAVPFLPGVVEFVERGVCPGGTKRNLEHFGRSVDFDPSLTESQRLAIADAQTSGGLLIACPPDAAPALDRALREAAVPVVARIGRFTAEHPGRIRVAV